MYGYSRGGYRKPAKKEKKKNTDEQRYQPIYHRLIDPKNFS